MSDIIAAGENTLIEGANAVNTAKSAIDTNIGAVRSDMEELKSIWTGAAAMSFTQLMTNWNDKAKKLNAVLVDLEDALRGTQRDQAASEEAHQQTIASLGSMMNG